MRDITDNETGMLLDDNNNNDCDYQFVSRDSDDYVEDCRGEFRFELPDDAYEGESFAEYSERKDREEKIEAMSTILPVGAVIGICDDYETYMIVGRSNDGTEYYLCNYPEGISDNDIKRIPIENMKRVYHVGYINISEQSLRGKLWGNRMFSDKGKAILKDKIKGCLMGGAIGDALGYEVEFITWDSIRKLYGEKGIQDLVTHEGKARFSDDTQMTLFTCEGMEQAYHKLLQTGKEKQVTKCVYQAYLSWLKSQGHEVKKLFWKNDSKLLQIPELNVQRAPGNTCLSALGSGDMGTIEKPVNNSKGCGGVMRTAPLGFTLSLGDPMKNGANAAAITHGHPGGWMPAGMLSMIICRILYTTYGSLEQVIEESLLCTISAWEDLPYTEEFEKMIRNAMNLSRTNMPDVEAIHSIGGGWVGDEALAIAVYCCMKHKNDFRGMLISAVNHSGDSDSTGAIAGNIMGAYLGYDSIPDEWKAEIEIPEVISQEADNIMEIIEHSVW